MGKGSSGLNPGTGGNKNYRPADMFTRSVHNSQIKKLSSSAYADGTYDLDTLKPLEYNKGYQVTFSQIGDNYSATQYMDKVNEFLAVSSDGKVAAGKFESTPEISFHVNSKSKAIQLAKKYNQISIWDWGKCDEIKTGGTGRVK